MTTSASLATAAAGPGPRGHRLRSAALLAGALLLAGGLAGSDSRASAAPPPGTGLVCTAGPAFALVATRGRVTTPEGNNLLMWSYGPDDAAGGRFQLPGPVLCVTEGQQVTVTLRNALAEPTSIVFPGQVDVQAAGGTPGLLTAEAAPGGTVSYSFLAGQPGTYLYESGSRPDKQVQMGLYGALVVRPALGPGYAYNDPATRFDPAREYLMVLHDIDPDLHLAVERGRPFNPTNVRDKYWTINGRSFPDTVADNGVPWLPDQPYGSMVAIQPYDATANPLPALIRYLNAGMFAHPVHPHGNHLRLLARDGRLLRGPAGQDTTRESFTENLPPGGTADMTFTWTDVDRWNPATNPVPVTVPPDQNLVFKDGETWYGGSPYLGVTDDLPVGVTSHNECGEYYFPWHSHALNEFTNWDAGFGGMSTLGRVDPPGGCPQP
jgi:FtsP/CotA-like multicopper oxidase with cupredoxin domain